MVALQLIEHVTKYSFVHSQSKYRYRYGYEFGKLEFDLPYGYGLCIGNNSF